MLAVCAVLSIAAAVALPTAQPVAEFRADAAAGEVVLALRYARDEAIRTGEWRMFRCDAGDTVSVLAFAKNDPNQNASAVPHPASRAGYSVPLGTVPSGSNMKMLACSFAFDKGAAATAVAFDAAGKPVRGTGGAAARDESLGTGIIVVGAGRAARTVAIDAAGRVTSS